MGIYFDFYREKVNCESNWGCNSRVINFLNFRVVIGSLFSNDILYNFILFYWYIISIICYFYLCCIIRNIVGLYRWK